ncbi:PspC domain-containing protein [Euzebya sp.]|uniref:PspC domain-containing protein n=1 Tax=Euzebya sp. TaxID=1971409 RepID=UPI0035115D64
MATTTLQRPRRGDGRMIAGVCAGLARRFGVSTSLVRLGFIVFGLVGAGELAYVILWVIMPKAPRGGW